MQLADEFGNLGLACRQHGHPLGSDPMAAVVEGISGYLSSLVVVVPTEPKGHQGSMVEDDRVEEV